MLCHVVWYMLTVVSETFTASYIKVMMSSSIFQTARYNIPEDSHLLHFAMRTLYLTSYPLL
jgi:hypothetical protein